MLQVLAGALACLGQPVADAICLLLCSCLFNKAVAASTMRAELAISLVHMQQHAILNMLQ